MGNWPEFYVLEQIYKEKLPFSPGANAPGFTLNSIEGKPVSLSDFKGKLVYIDFWASWCGPCMREVPAGEELKKAFAGKDVVFLNISIDEDEYKWKESAKNKGISGIHLIANSKNSPEVLEAYKVSSIPSYFLVGKDGKFIASPAVRPSNASIYNLIELGLKQ
ncbi:MAG: TlpA family protein disulfide reductase [Bacteroidia bacterium]|nr:TlpA family protein disulfide reductase [Bacteroidia bacterium]